MNLHLSGSKIVSTTEILSCRAELSADWLGTSKHYQSFRYTNETVLNSVYVNKLENRYKNEVSAGIWTNI